MKNVLVTSNYKLKNKHVGRNMDHTVDLYDELTRICVQSFRKNLIGLDEVVVLRKAVDGYDDMCKDIYWSLREMYLGGGQNLLYVDSDCVCIRPTKLFGEFQNFSMFDVQNRFQTAFPAHVPKELYQNLHPWMMSNVRLYPERGVTPTMWKIADELANSWIPVWAYECIVYNELFHMQGFSESDVMQYFYRPELNTQWMEDQGTPEQLRRAHIVHVQSSRGTQEAKRKMLELMQ